MTTTTITDIDDNKDIDDGDDNEDNDCDTFDGEEDDHNNYGEDDDDDGGHSGGGGAADDGDDDDDSSLLSSSIDAISVSVRRISLVNSAIVSYFVEDLHLRKYFDIFRNFLFLEDGEFALSLSDQIFEKVKLSRHSFVCWLLRVCAMNVSIQRKYHSVERCRVLFFFIGAIHVDCLKSYELGRLFCLQGAAPRSPISEILHLDMIQQAAWVKENPSHIQ